MIVIVEIQSPCIRRRRIVNHGIISISLILFLLLHSFPSVRAQPPPPPAGQFPYQFNPSVAAIIIVLIAALFFMGFFSVYIRQCYDISPSGTGNSFRRGAGGIGASLRRRTARGLDKTVIENLPTFPYSEVKELKIGKGALECAVCLNEFDDEEILRLLPKCDHVFHPECIDAWLQSHVTCPVCRSNLAAAEQSETTDDNPESIPAPAVATGENPVNEEVTIQIEDERTEENDRNRHPAAVDRARSLNQIRPPPLPPASKSIRGWPFWSKFPRSHSTGHSLVQPGENTDRFTLRLPEEVRKEVMTRALNRTRSVLLPSEGRTGRGHRSGWASQEGSSRGIRFSGRVKSDRWVFTKAPPFFSRALSVKSPRVAADGGEGSTSSRTPRSGGGSMNVKLPSFKCLEPNAKDEETGLVMADSIKTPVPEGGLH